MPTHAELERINVLEDLTRHPGWDILVASMQQIYNADMQALMRPNREKGMPDDYLRGRMSMALWLTSGIHQDIVNARKDAEEGPPPDSQPAGDPYQPEQGGPPAEEN